MTVMKNYTLQDTIKTYSGMNFSWLIGFGYLVDTNTTYYALDYGANRIIIFDENWKYLTYKNLNKPAYMITVNASLIISGNNNIYKTDKYMNNVNLYNNPSALYRGLYFNSSSNSIYVAVNTRSAIDVLDLNLTLVDSIPTSTYQPWSIQGYKNYIYVGTTSGHLLVIENKVIIKSFPVCGANLTLSSILIDQFDYMVLNCFPYYGYIYYRANISYTGMKRTYAMKTRFTTFDSNSHLILISYNEINIYY